MLLYITHMAQTIFYLYRVELALSGVLPTLTELKRLQTGLKLERRNVKYFYCIWKVFKYLMSFMNFPSWHNRHLCITDHLMKSHLRNIFMVCAID